MFKVGEKYIVKKENPWSLGSKVGDVWKIDSVEKESDRDMYFRITVQKGDPRISEGVWWGDPTQVDLLFEPYYKSFPMGPVDV